VSGVRQHQCAGCGKAFATSSGLKQHQHIHSSIKPFRCDVCHKAYTQFSNLCRHKRMHADCRQRIRCPDCDQTFATTTSLAKHRRFCDGLTRPAGVSSRRNRDQYLSHAGDASLMTAAATDCATKHVTSPSETSAAMDLPQAPSLLQSLVTSCGWKTSSLPHELPLMTPEPTALNTSIKPDDDGLVKKSQLIGVTTKQPSDFGIRRLLECHSSDVKKPGQHSESEGVQDPPPSPDCDPDHITNDERQEEPLDLSTRSTARDTCTDGRSDSATPASESSLAMVDADRPASDDETASSLCSASPFQHTDVERSLMLSSISLPATLLGSLFYEHLQQQRKTWIDKSVDTHPFDVLQKASLLSAHSKPLPVDLIHHQSTLSGLLSRPFPVGIGSTSLPLPVNPSSADARKDGRRQSSMSSSQRSQQPHRYGCRFCGKMFPRSANLTRHLRTHTGEQPYRCGYCERSFSISSNLQRHVRNIHNRERPLSCPLCERCFGQQTNLDRHLKKHEFDASAAAATAGLRTAARARSPPGRDIAGESYLLELRRFVVRACGLDVDDPGRQVAPATKEPGCQPPDQYRSKSPSQIWSPARHQPSTVDPNDGKRGTDEDAVVGMADSERSTTSSGVEDSRSPSCDNDDNDDATELFSPLRLVQNINSPIHSVVC